MRTEDVKAGATMTGHDERGYWAMVDGKVYRPRVVGALILWSTRLRGERKVS